MTCPGCIFSDFPQLDRDEVLGMVRTVIAWRKRHNGRRPGHVHNYLCAVADEMGDRLTFDALVLELRYRLLRGFDSDLILDDVDTGAETVTWCEPGKSCHVMPFSTLANKWSKVRKLKIRNL